VTITRTGGLNSLYAVSGTITGGFSAPDRTGDLRTVLTIGDFYSARQWHSTGMFADIYRPQGFEHELMLTLPTGPNAT
jgi:hypothetical protein